MRTASPNERFRRRWSLSSREVKSTGEKVRVVILPSTVMAKVAKTKGRSGCVLLGGTCFCTSPSRERGLVRLGRAEARPSEALLVRRSLLRFGNFMLEDRHFLFHLTQFNMTLHAARFIKEVNDSPRRATGEGHEKTHRADQDCDRFRHVAKPVQHDLENLFAQTDAGETDRQRGDGTLDRHDSKKI